jgi:hypothetical protein
MKTKEINTDGSAMGTRHLPLQFVFRSLMGFDCLFL